MSARKEHDPVAGPEVAAETTRAEAAEAAAEKTANKGAPNGYAGLDGSGVLPAVNARPYNPRGAVQPNTAYGRWDTVVYRDKIILITTSTSSDSSSFIGSANYIVLVTLSHYHAANWGVVGDGTTDNAALLATALAYVAAQGGGVLELPRGQVMVSTTVDIPTMVVLKGQGVSFNGTQIKLLPNSNCDVVSFHKSTGSGNSNAFWCGLMDLSIHGANSTQATTDFHHCLNVTTNPVTTQQTGDPDFDPAHFLSNVHLRNASGHGYFHSGRSDVTLVGVHAKFNRGHGFSCSFDTEFTNCRAGFNGAAGWYLPSSATGLAACKSYNNGNVPTWTTGQTWAAGAYAYFNGHLYVALNALTADAASPDTDPTNWQNVATVTGWGTGFYLDGCSEVTLAACDAQQNSGSSYHLHNTTACSLQGVSAQHNWSQTGGALNTTNPNFYAAVVLDGAKGSVVGISARGMNAGNSPLRVVNAAANNDVRMAGDTSAGSTLTSDSSALGGTTNTVTWNGTVLNMAGVTGALAANPAPYVRTGGGYVMPPGAQVGAATIAMTNGQLLFVPMALPRAGMTVSSIAIRVSAAGSAGSVVRVALYTSDLSGNDTLALLEDAGTIDASTTGIKELTLPTPQTIAGQVVWVALAAQGAPATNPTLIGMTGALVSGQSNNALAPAVAFFQNGITAAAPATLLGPGVAAFAVGTTAAFQMKVSG